MAEPPPRQTPLLGVLGSMNPPVGGQRVDQAVGLAHVFGQRIGHIRRFELVEHRAHGLGQAPTGQRLGGRVDGQGAGEEGLALGLVEVIENLEAWAGQLFAAAVQADSPRHERRGARRELVDLVVHETDGAEHDHVHGRGPVGDGGLHNGRRAAAPGASRAGTDDPNLNGGLLPVGQGAQVGQFSPGVVATRQEAQEPSRSADPLLGELVGGPLAQRLVQRAVQQGHGPAGGCGSRAHADHSRASRTSGRACPPAWTTTSTAS